MAGGQVLARVIDEQLVATRYSQLVPAAKELFFRKGFHKTSVRELADAAGWQMGTLYRYISCKEDVLHLIAESVSKDCIDTLLGVKIETSARGTLHNAILDFFRTANRLRREMRLIYRESASLLPQHLEIQKQRELEQRQILSDMIRRGIEGGEFRPVNPDLMAQTILMLASMWALKRWALVDFLDFDTYCEHQLDLLFSRLTPAAEEIHGDASHSGGTVRGDREGIPGGDSKNPIEQRPATDAAGLAVP